MINSRDNQGDKSLIGVTEGVRRTTGVTPIAGPIGPPNPEVKEKKSRRRFTAQYKLRILEEVDACTEPGQQGALLRREGLYSSNLTQVATTAGGRAPVRLEPTAKGPETKTEKSSRRTSRRVGKEKPASRKSIKAGQDDH